MSAEQGTAAWLAERAGKITASRFRDVIAKLKSGLPAKAREDYVWQVVVERLTGRKEDNFTSSAMQWGVDNEHNAQAAYAARTGAFPEDVGFIAHPRLPRVGGSPDNLIGSDGLSEYKCPFNSAIHLQTFLGGMPDEHRAQVQGLMWITDRAWCDFVSHDPRLPPPFDLYVERIARDNAYIHMLETEIESFDKDVETMIARLNMRGAAT